MLGIDTDDGISQKNIKRDLDMAPTR